MTVKPWAGFIADFPDDEVGDGRSIDVFGGRNVAVAIGEILIGLGCSDISAPEYAEHKGWEFDFYDKGRHRFWCQVTSFHPAFWLLFEDPAITRGTRAKNAKAYAELWRRLALALDQDGRFHDVVWRSMEDGPPQPEDIGSPAARREAGGIAPVPIEDEFRPAPPKARQSRWGCLPYILALCVMTSGATDLVIGLSDARAGRLGTGENIVPGIALIIVGGLWFLRTILLR